MSIALFTPCRAASAALRMSFNGRTSASQAENAGSIPVIRSKAFGQVRANLQPPCSPASVAPLVHHPSLIPQYSENAALWRSAKGSTAWRRGSSQSLDLGCLLRAGSGALPEAKRGHPGASVPSSWRPLEQRASSRPDLHVGVVACNQRHPTRGHRRHVPSLQLGHGHVELCDPPTGLQQAELLQDRHTEYQR